MESTDENQGQSSYAQDRADETYHGPGPTSEGLAETEPRDEAREIRAPEPKPSKGRIVLYTFPAHAALGFNEGAGQERTVPAVITNVWSDECVNLRVFTDGSQPCPSVTSVLRGDATTEREHGFWEWPTRV